MWIRKYAPVSLSDVQGQNAAVSRLKTYVENYKGEEKKAILLWGPPGTGKTSSAVAVALEKDFELVEINASDDRKPDEIEERVGNAIRQGSLFQKGKLILIDEIDGISGTRDRGGILSISRLISKSPYPIVITANDPYDKKFSEIRKLSLMVQFHSLNYLSVSAVLKRVCEAEDVKFDEAVLKSLARRSGGDLRAALNDLQMISSDGRVDNADLDSLSDRNQVEKMHQALLKVFKTTDADLAKTAFDNVEEDLDKVMLWVDENLPKEYGKPDDLERAYMSLSKADVYRGRIRRWQHWHFLVYVNVLLSAGVACAKDEKYKGFIPYSPSSRILLLWHAKMRNAKRDPIATKIALKTHTSKRRVIKDTLPFFGKAANSDAFGDILREELSLEDDELKFLRHKL